MPWRSPGHFFAPDDVSLLATHNSRQKKRHPVLGGGPTMLDGMFTWGGEEFSRGTLDVRCEFDANVKTELRNSIELEGAMPAAVPTSSWRFAAAVKIIGETHPYCSVVSALLQAEIWAKKTPPVSGWRSNYAHLTDINIQSQRHRFVKSARA